MEKHLTGWHIRCLRDSATGLREAGAERLADACEEAYLFLNDLFLDFSHEGIGLKVRNSIPEDF